MIADNSTARLFQALAILIAVNLFLGFGLAAFVKVMGTGNDMAWVEARGYLQ